ncbi:hypothetical protein Tco_1021724, partial [Tanacetum coccineum]
QNRRDLPRDISLDRIEVLRYDAKRVKVRKGIMQTKTELTLKQTQQGVSDEVLVSIEGVEESKRKVKIKGEKKEALLILRQKLEHQSDTKVFILTMKILLEPTSNKLCGSSGNENGSADAKPCQGDPFEFYLITCSIYTDQQGTVVDSLIGQTKSKVTLRKRILSRYGICFTYDAKHLACLHQDD